jgi:glycosyltransferase involved in cell wall biosynthesis
MEPLLSVVVPVHNQTGQLPALLESVARQSFAALEVVIVDDASTEGRLEDVVSVYRNRGLAVRLHTVPNQVYTKEARLTGIEFAAGDIIVFADADDEFMGEDILERHVRQWAESGCDVLHFRTMRLHDSAGERNYNSWADSFAPELKGQAIFEEYSKGLAGHVMWNKLYSRRIWLKCIEFARSIPITVCSEDLFLSTLYLFHARHYVGSDLVGYAHHYEDKIAAKSAGRAVAFFIMLKELLPYLRACGCSPMAYDNLARRLRSGCQSYANRACLEAVQGDFSASPYSDNGVFADIPPAARLMELLLYANERNAEHLTFSARNFAGDTVPWK